jgi:hypothetical protein
MLDISSANLTPLRELKGEQMENKKEFYKKEICQITGKIAELLDAGFSVEIAKSRSGIKIYSVCKRHHVIRRQRAEFKSEKEVKQIEPKQK